MALKDYYDGQCARILGEMLLPHHPGFDVECYVREVDDQVGPLELKDRVHVLAHGLRERLDSDYAVAVDTLVRALPAEIEGPDGAFTAGWALSPVARFVEEFGHGHPEASLAALEEITKRHTGEFAIRPFLRQHHDLTMATVHRWVPSPNEHVRRLASEGLRTRLPWTAHYQPFKDDPSPLIEAITPLIADPSRYVRTSVANNLNDISRDNPQVALNTAERWLGLCDAEETRWIVTKGLRTLVKKGDPEALRLVGADAHPSITVTNVQISPVEVRVGESATITAEVHNGSDVARNVIVNYQLHFLKKNGLTRPTTFALKKLTLGPRERARLVKRHVFRKVTTRTYYPGVQGLTVHANGSPSELVEFELRAEE